MTDTPDSSPSAATARRHQNRPIDETDFEQIRMFAHCGLHWAGFHSWFGRPIGEIRRCIFDAWPDLFRQIEVNDAQEAKKREPRRK